MAERNHCNIYSTRPGPTQWTNSESIPLLSTLYYILSTHYPTSLSFVSYDVLLQRNRSPLCSYLSESESSVYDQST